MAQDIVTKIVPLRSDPNIRRIHVGRRVAATLRASDIETLRITLGAAWTASLAKAAAETTELNAARKAAMSILSRRPLSKAEVLERLVRKGHPQPIAARIVEQLVVDRWIDDAAYGNSIVEEVRGRRPAGKRLLVERLTSRKIERDAAQRIADEVCSGTDPRDDAVRLARQRFDTMGDLPRVTARRRLASLLARRGFDEDTTEAALHKLGLGFHEEPNMD